MNNFEFKNPTKILFGKGEIKKIKNEIPEKSKVLMLYGGGSIKSNGIYNQCIEALKEHQVIEFSGIPANPEYEVLLKALEVIKNEDIDFLLAVGGGSVIDGTKFLATAAKKSLENPWEILTKSIRTNEGEALPFGTVLTLPATGSEMNSGFVISRKETKEKLAAGGPGLFPQFSVLDPEVIKSVPTHQLANGIADAYTHVLEQYMTYPVGAALQDRFSESILNTLQEVSSELISGNFDYKIASNFMWSCTMALNGLIQKGVPADWSVHAIGHELTAQFGIDHARTLAIIAPHHYTYCFEQKKDKLAQYAETCWDITKGTIEEKAKKGIEKLEKFFHSIGISTKLSSYTNNYEGTAKKIKETFIKRNWTALGEHKNLTPDDVEKIVKMSY